MNDINISKEFSKNFEDLLSFHLDIKFLPKKNDFYSVLNALSDKILAQQNTAYKKLYTQKHKSFSYSKQQGSSLDGTNNNDILLVSPNQLTVHAGRGNDTVLQQFLYHKSESIHHKKLTIGKKIDGGEGDDIIEGNHTDDILDGGTHEDIIIANDGNDLAHGGSGNDKILGNHGHDQLFGDGNDDFLFDDHGNNILEGGAGNDLLAARGNGYSLIDGGHNHNVIDGGTGRHLMLLRGHNFIRCSIGDNRLYLSESTDKNRHYIWHFNFNKRHNKDKIYVHYDANKYDLKTLSLNIENTIKQSTIIEFKLFDRIDLVAYSINIGNHELYFVSDQKFMLDIQTINDYLRQNICFVTKDTHDLFVSSIQSMRGKGLVPSWHQIGISLAEIASK